VPRAYEIQTGDHAIMHPKNCSLVAGISLLALADAVYGQVVSLTCTTDVSNLTTTCGSQALRDQGSGEALGGTAFGIEALSENQGGQNTAVGTWALQSNGSGSGNTAVGDQSLRTNDEGNLNTAIGFQALNVVVLN
jgi:hypothetical protein